MSNEEFRSEFKRIEDEAERDLAKLSAIGALLLTLIWAAILLNFATDIINRI